MVKMNNPYITRKHQYKVTFLISKNIFFLDTTVYNE